jgi:GTPase SAR1 family protein
MGNEPSRAYHEGMHPNSEGMHPSGVMMSGLTSPRTPTLRRSKSADAQKFASPNKIDSIHSNSTTSTSTSTPNTMVHNTPNNPKINRTIQKMDKQIRKRVRGGITYNMKILIRGAKGTGKTSLFQRLKGEPIPEIHESTPQIQTAHINWNFKTNSEENVKCEVWDVVDRGNSFSNEKENTNHENETFNKQQQDIIAAAKAAAEATEAEVHRGTWNGGTHLVATVDASTVDVYHETHGVIFLLDITQLHTLEYVKQELEKVPLHLPTLVLGNFRDIGQQRKVFKEDIQELLYGSDRVKVHRRPQEIMYFECSLLNCYGLKSLHKYFGIPFLQLKLGTLRQQLRILEGDFVRLKHDVQTNIEDQRYGEYMEHIKATGSDIKTGKRRGGRGGGGGGGGIHIHSDQTPPPFKVKDEHDQEQDYDQDQEKEKENEDIIAGQAQQAEDKKSNNIKEVVEEMDHFILQEENTRSYEKKGDVDVEVEVDEDDGEDLPERKTMDTRRLNSLKIAYDPRETTLLTQEQVDVSKLTLPLPISTENLSSPTHKTTKKPPHKASMEQAISLEDFQFKTDLDNFYSEEESEEEDDDADVVVMQAVPLTTISSNKTHKQKFIDSDSEESDHEEERAEEKSSPSSPSLAVSSPPSLSLSRRPEIPPATQLKLLETIPLDTPSCMIEVSSSKKPELDEKPSTAICIPHDPVKATATKEEDQAAQLNSYKQSNTASFSTVDLSASVLSPKEKLDESFFEESEEDANGTHEIDTKESSTHNKQQMILHHEDDDSSSSCGQSSVIQVQMKSPPVSPVSTSVPISPPSPTGAQKIADRFQIPPTVAVMESTGTCSSPKETLNEAFFDEELTGSGEEEQMPTLQMMLQAQPVEGPSVAKKSTRGRHEMIMHDEEPETPSNLQEANSSPKIQLDPIGTCSVTPTTVSTDGGPQLFMIMSPNTTLDEGFFSDVEDPIVKEDNVINSHFIPAPALSLDKGFFSDDAESEASPCSVVTTLKPPPQAVIDDDEEEEEYVERFAQYDRKKISSKSSRRKARNLWSFNDTPASQAPKKETTACVISSDKNENVMAAIHRAQEEALRMLKTSKTFCPNAQETTENEKKKKKTKKNNSKKESHRSRRTVELK